MNWDDVINVAWNFVGKARARHFTPKAFVMGVSLFYGLRWYILNHHAIAYNDTNGHERLFGLPIKFDVNDKWGLSLEVEEFSMDFSVLIDADMRGGKNERE